MKGNCKKYWEGCIFMQGKMAGDKNNLKNYWNIFNTFHVLKKIKVQISCTFQSFGWDDTKMDLGRTSKIVHDATTISLCNCASLVAKRSFWH